MRDSEPQKSGGQGDFVKISSKTDLAQIFRGSDLSEEKSRGHKAIIGSKGNRPSFDRCRTSLLAKQERPQGVVRRPEGSGKGLRSNRIETKTMRRRVVVAAGTSLNFGRIAIHERASKDGKIVRCGWSREVQ